MARRRRKKARHGRHRKRRMSAKQRRAAMRNLKKARKALRRGKRRHGKRRKSRKGRKRSRRRSHGRRRSGGHRRHGQSRLSNKAHQVYQTLINRGRSPQQAHRVAARIDRMRSGRVKRYFEREAMAAKSKAALANVFAGFGAAGHLAKSAG